MVPNIFVWGLFGLSAWLLARAVQGLRRLRQHTLPGNFDFDHYKSREIAQRGVFDKTKWH